MSAAARALDAADGVIDGRYYGRPIVQAGGPSFVGAPAGYPTTFAQGGYAATPLIRTAAPSVIPATNSALALDAADGVIDGRFYGRPIVQGASPAYGGAVFGGAPLVGGVSTFAPQVVSSPYVTNGLVSGGYVNGGYVNGGLVNTGFVNGGLVNGGFVNSGLVGGSFVGGAPLVRSVPTTVGSSALALDAADGVIDGRFYGRPIVQGAAPAYGGAVLSGAPIGASYFGGAPLLSGAVQPAFYQQPTFNSVVPTTQVLRSVPTAGVSSTAAALDAADGVMDGRYFGRPIVQGGRPF